MLGAAAAQESVMLEEGRYGGLEEEGPPGGLF
jgi:hypothetical protein